MQITNVSIPAPTCDNHITVNFTAGGQARSIQVARADFALDPSEVPEAVIYRLRSWAKENGYTLAQVRANLPGKTFHI